MTHLKNSDEEIFNAITAETVRQEENLELIASENIISPAIEEALGSSLSNKYAEGYPGKRYYNGCECVDIVETLAIERAKKLFNAAYANVQPHSGSQANMAVYFAALKPGDTILGMSLAAGGHLTHGSSVSFSGSIFKAYSYGVDRDDERIDFDEVELLAERHKPKMIVAGASAYPRAIDFKRFKEIADRVGALLLVDMAHIAGLVAAGVHDSPLPYADFVTATTHKTLRGPRGGLILLGKNEPNRFGIIAAKSGRVKDTGELVDSAIFPFGQGGPLEHVIAGKAICFKEASTSRFIDYQKQVVANSKALGLALRNRGLRLVTGGTDNHMCLVDLRPLGVSGKVAAEALDRAGITVNKNAIPFETASAHETSGIRVGTPTLTTRGMGEKEMEMVAELMLDAIRARDDAGKLAAIKKETIGLTQKFPVEKIRF